MAMARRLTGSLRRRQLRPHPQKKTKCSPTGGGSARKNSQRSSNHPNPTNSRRTRNSNSPAQKPTRSPSTPPAAYPNPSTPNSRTLPTPTTPFPSKPPQNSVCVCDSPQYHLISSHHLPALSHHFPPARRCVCTPCCSDIHPSLFSPLLPPPWNV